MIEFGVGLYFAAVVAAAGRSLYCHARYKRLYRNFGTLLYPRWRRKRKCALAILLALLLLPAAIVAALALIVRANS